MPVGFTVRVKVVIRVNPPPVPVIVIVYVLAVVLLELVTVIELVKRGLPLEGEKLVIIVGSGGETVTDRVTA